MSYQEAVLGAACECVLTLLGQRDFWSEAALRKESGLSIGLFKEVLAKLLAEQKIQQQFGGAAGSEVQLVPILVSPAEMLEGPPTLQAHQVLLRLKAGPEGVRALSRRLRTCR